MPLDGSRGGRGGQSNDLRAGRGRGIAGPPPIEQDDAKALLDGRQAPGDRRVVQAQRGCHGGQTAVFTDGLYDP
jgi:hypothetical protein